MNENEFEGSRFDLPFSFGSYGKARFIISENNYPTTASSFNTVARRSESMIPVPTRNDSKPVVGSLDNDLDGMKESMLRHEATVSSNGLMIFTEGVKDYTKSHPSTFVSDEDFTFMKNPMAVVIDGNWTPESPAVDEKAVLKSAGMRKAIEWNDIMFWSVQPLNIYSFTFGYFAEQGGLWMIFGIPIWLFFAAFMAYSVFTKVQNNKKFINKTLPGIGLFPVDESFIIADVWNVEEINQLFTACENNPIIVDALKRKFQRKHSSGEIDAWVSAVHSIYKLDKSFPAFNIPDRADDVEIVRDAFKKQSDEAARRAIEANKVEKELVEFREGVLDGFDVEDSATTRDAALEYVKFLEQDN